MPPSQSPPAHPAPPRYVDHLLWVDCTGGAVVGAAVLALSAPLSDLFGLPRGVLLVTGAANVLYAAYSFSLARRSRPSRGAVAALAVANVAWAPVCAGILAVWGLDASALGVAHFVLEGAYVGALGAVEWRWRDRLSGSGL